MLVGLGIVLFKLLSIAGIRLSRFSSFLWPSAMVLLGTLLIFYRRVTSTEFCFKARLLIRLFILGMVTISELMTTSALAAMSAETPMRF
jgi:hypothetical protein